MHPKHMFDKKNDNHFWGKHIFMSSLLFELLILPNKSSSPQDIEFMRFDCITIYFSRLLWLFFRSVHYHKNGYKKTILSAVVDFG